MRTLFVAFVSLLLVSCSGGVKAPQQAPQIGQTPAAATQNVPEYRLGSGDRLRVIVFGEEGLSGEFVVDGSGYVSLPLIGEVSAVEKTVREFQTAVELALKDGYLNDPRVSAEVKNFRPYYILGEVRQPGDYPFTDGLTVVNAVAAANGFTYRANQRTVFIRRAGEEDEEPYVLDSTTVVRPGDTIRVGERLF